MLILTMLAPITSSSPVDNALDGLFKFLLSSTYRHLCESRAQKPQVGFSPVQRTFFLLQLRQAWGILLRRFSVPSESYCESDIGPIRLSFRLRLVEKWGKREEGGYWHGYDGYI